MIHRTGSGKAAGKPKNGASRRLPQRVSKKIAPARTLITGGLLPWILGGAVTLLLALLMTSGFVTSPITYRAGDVARRDIRARQEMRVEDTLATQALKQEAREKVLAHYDIDSKLGEEIAERLRTAFETIQKTLALQAGAVRSRLLEENAQDPAHALLSESRVFEEVFKTPAFRTAEEAFEKSLGGGIPPEMRQWLRAERYASWIYEDIILLVRTALSREVVSDRQLYAKHSAKGIIVRDIRTGNRVALSSSADPLELREVAGFLRRQRGELSLKSPPRMITSLAAAAARLIRPTLTFNNRATVEAQKEAAEKVGPVSQVVKEGEMIVRVGDLITESQLVKLKGLEETSRKGHILDNFTGSAIVVFLLLLLGWLCAQRYMLSILRTPKSVTLFALLIVVHALLVKLGVLFAHNLHDSYRNIALSSFYFVIPFASASMLAALLQGRSAAILMAVISAGLAGLLLPSKIHYVLIALAGGVYAALRWKEYRRRSSILVAGLFIGLIGAALVFGFNMQEGLRTALGRWEDVPIAFLGGLTNVIFVSALMPLLESLFKLTTDMRLLELSDQNHPLLRQMVVRAPGTYHHSLMVGNLAEEAAEVVDANPLLARVGAYFHDVGKMLKPEYFIENQGRENRHDRLNPSMSALILISHVKEGVELARAHNLPKEITDMISQHHGTSLIRFFYNKAKTQKGGDEVREEAFCYPGPRPQTREAGILMLADMVEASSRALSDPSPGRLSGLVERTVQSAFADGQLDECDLTLRDLGRIQEAFLRVLAGIHHHRVAYPGQQPADRKGGTNGGAHLKPAKAGADRHPSLAPAGGSGPGKTPLA